MTLSRSYYPEIEPYAQGHLSVGDGHEIYWETSGNPQGIPVVFLHGGPGSGTYPHHRRFFNPEKYRIVLLDQRGCGKSAPFGELKNNTTWDLVEDLEKLRKHLEIKKWLIFGGSWGATLALTYAIEHTKSVHGIILRGTFLARPQDSVWFFKVGASKVFPEFWQRFIEFIPEEERDDLVEAYAKRLQSSDNKIQREAAFHWAAWEGCALKLELTPQEISFFSEEHHAWALSRIETYYFQNRCFFDSPNWILERISKLVGLPITIVHGRYDMVCPVGSSWEVAQALKGSCKLEIVQLAGHASSEVGTLDCLIKATDSFILN